MSHRRGILVIISSPSGAGKSTLARRLLDEFPSVQFSVSYTTRPMRPGEVDGEHYHFVTTEQFQGMVDRYEFAEFAEVHGNQYGTSKRAVDLALRDGKDVVFDVDYQGGYDLKKQFPDDALMVFILPPDLDTLESRLRRRATDADDVIARRLDKAIDELSFHGGYDYRVVNDDLDRAYALLRAIYLVRRYRADEGGVDAPADLDACRALVGGNDEAANKRHAESLVSAGKRRRGH